MSSEHSGILSRNRSFLIKCVNAAAVVGVVVAYNTWAYGVLANDMAVTARMEEEAEAARAASDVRGPYATDGDFSGSAQGYGGTVTTSVTIENGYIIGIDAIEHSGETEAYFEQAESLIQDILETQGTNVDTVSGATFSSAAIINGTNEALKASGVAGAGE